MYPSAPESADYAKNATQKTENKGETDHENETFLSQPDDFGGVAVVRYCASHGAERSRYG